MNTLTLKLYYRFLTTNFKTFFDCKAQIITVSGTLNPLKTLLQIIILVVSQLDMLSAVKKTKKTINFFEAKIDNKLFCSYLIFFAFHVNNTRNF